MAGLGCCHQNAKTSTELAQSVNTSASFIRRTMAKLSKAGLVETATGKAGTCWLAQKPKQISLLDIYHAVSAPKAFSIHSYPENKPCEVSCHIKGALDKALDKTQRAFEASLAKISLEDIIADIKQH